MLRRRQQKKIFLCFYCNKTSSIQVDRSTPLRKWYCAECEQTNHLDENGEIADVVPFTDTSPAPPLRPLSPASSPALSIPPPFCETCISNQTLLIKNLASFLPPEDHPDYDTYAAALPAHKAELEVKYPQVCEDCEERVRARLHRNNYLAKTSALGGFLRRRRNGTAVEQKWDGWTWIKVGIWYVRGGMWWVTSIGFLIWCLLGVVHPESIGARWKVASFGQDEPFRISLPLALEKLFDSLPRQKFMTVPRYLALISPFVVMWDYKWLQVQQIPGSHVEGLREYRELQLIVLITRFLAWATIKYIQDALITTSITAFLGILSLIALIWSLGILKIRLPPEIALQDSLDDFSPQSSPTPSRTQYTFQRTQPLQQPRLPSTSLRHDPIQPPAPRNEPLDLSTLGISEKPLPTYNNETMDWTPSTQSNTFTHPKPPYSRDTSVFATGRGTLPPAPGTTFSSPPSKPSKLDWFQPSASAMLQNEPRVESRGIELREQRYFAKQESTGLEALLGQALRLEDEPTLVRAVKAVKRTMARDERVRRGYINLAIAALANLVGLGGWVLGGRKVGVALSWVLLGGAWISTRLRGGLLGGVAAVIFGLMIMVPALGVTIPYHLWIVRFYHPSIQSLLHHLSMFMLVGDLGWDISVLVNLKLEQRRMAKMEEERRREKMRGIFYTPAKASVKSSAKREGSLNGNFRITKRDVKSRSFAFS